MNKVYRKIPSMRFLYEIAEDGEIRNVKSKKVLKHIWYKNKPYHRVTYRENGRVGYKMIHQVVMEVWGIPKPDWAACIDHIDRNTHNNHMNNLRWVDLSESNKNRDYTNISRNSKETIKKAQAAASMIPHNGSKYKVELIPKNGGKTLFFNFTADAANWMLENGYGNSFRSLQVNLGRLKYVCGFYVKRTLIKPVETIRK